MQQIVCPYCNVSYSSAGIQAHIRLKHPNNLPIDISAASITPVVSSVMPNTTGSNIALQQTLEQRRQELEIKRLEMEISRLEKPDTKIDYYDKMLELERKHNETLMQMQQKNFDTTLEIEKLKLSNGSDDMMPFLVENLLPLLPKILEKKAETPTTAIGNPTTAPVEGVKVMDTSQVPPEYIADVKAGKITEEQAYRDLKLAKTLGKLPKDFLMPTKKDFHRDFEGIKNGV